MADVEDSHPLTRPAILQHVLAFGCPNVRALARKIEVHSTWCDTVQNYASRAFEAHIHTHPAAFQNSFLRACERGTIWLIREMFLACLNVNDGSAKMLLEAKDPVRQMTALHCACSVGNLTVVEVICEYASADSDLNTPTAMGTFPLQIAVTVRNTELFELLVKRGAKINLRGYGGSTVLHTAASSCDLEMIKHLVAHHLDELDVNAKDNKGATPAHVLIANRSNPQWVEALFVLLDTGKVDVLLKDCSGAQLLHLACSSGNLSVVSRLLSIDKSNINEVENDPPPRPGAPMFNFHFQIQQQITPGQRRYGNTPLILAVTGAICTNPFQKKESRAEAFTLIHQLFEMGADPSMKNAEGVSCLGCAVRTSVEDVELVQFLLEHGCDAQEREVGFGKNDRLLLHVAADLGRVKTGELLVKHGCPLSERDQGKKTPIHVAASSGRVDFVKFLLDAGVDVNERGEEEEESSGGDDDNGGEKARNQQQQQQHDDGGFAPLPGGGLGFGHGRGGFGGASPFDVRPKKMRSTPLHLACRANWMNVVKLLLERGADRTLEDADGNVPQVDPVLAYGRTSDGPRRQQQQENNDIQSKPFQKRSLLEKGTGDGGTGRGVGFLDQHQSQPQSSSNTGSSSNTTTTTPFQSAREKIDFSGRPGRVATDFHDDTFFQKSKKANPWQQQQQQDVGDDDASQPRETTDEQPSTTKPFSSAAAPASTSEQPQPPATATEFKFEAPQLPTTASTHFVSRKHRLEEQQKAKEEATKEASSSANPWGFASNSTTDTAKFERNLKNSEHDRKRRAKGSWG